MRGIIDAIKVKDGKITATVAGTDYNLSDIVEVTSPYTDDTGTTTQPDDTGTETQPDQTEGTDQTEQETQAAQAYAAYAERSDGELTPDDYNVDDLEDLEDIAEV